MNIVYKERLPWNFLYKVLVEVKMVDSDSPQWITKYINSDVRLTTFEVKKIAIEEIKEESTQYRPGSAGLVAEVLTTVIDTLTVKS